MAEGTWERGPTQYVSKERQANAEDRFREEYLRALDAKRHLFIATVGFYFKPPMRDGAMLDADSIIGPPTVGCFICELPYEPAMLMRCQGEPANSPWSDR